MFQVTLFAVKQNQHINVTILPGITTSLRPIEYGRCCWRYMMDGLANSINNFRPFHAVCRIAFVCKVSDLSITGKEKCKLFEYQA